MSDVTASPPRPARQTRPRRTSADRARDLALVATFAALVAVCSQLTIPLAVVAVPVTLQTFAVLLTGAVLGPWRGAAAVALYLAVGVAGAPVFAHGTGGLAGPLGPSGGYLLAFPLGALATGAVVHGVRHRGPVASAIVVALGGVAGTLVVYAVGVPVLAARTDMDLGAAWLVNLVFVPFDAAKVALVALTAPAVHRAFPALRARALVAAPTRAEAPA